MFAVKCKENLRDWRNGKKKSMPFVLSMIRREGKDYIMDYYFCMINLKGINCKNKHHIKYPNVPSAIKSISHGPDFLVSEPDGNMEYSSDSEHSDMTVVAEDDTYKPEEDNQPVTLTLVELNDLTRDLNLSKESAPLLGSCLKEKHLLAPGTTFYRYQDCEKKLIVFHVPGWVIIGLLQYCWIDQINRFRVWCNKIETFYWLIQQKSESSSST